MHRVVWTPSARRQLENRTPPAVGAAIWEFVNGPLAAEPYRLGKALRHELEGYRSARRGEYRVVYRVADNTVQILRVDHRLASPAPDASLLHHRISAPGR